MSNWNSINGHPFVVITPNGPTDGGDYGPNSANVSGIGLSTTGGIAEAVKGILTTGGISGTIIFSEYPQINLGSSLDLSALIAGLKLIMLGPAKISSGTLSSAFTSNNSVQGGTLVMRDLEFAGNQGGTGNIVQGVALQGINLDLKRCSFQDYGANPCQSAIGSSFVQSVIIRESSFTRVGPNTIRAHVHIFERNQVSTFDVLGGTSDNYLSYSENELTDGHSTVDGILPTGGANIDCGGSGGSSAQRCLMKFNYNNFLRPNINPISMDTISDYTDIHVLRNAVHQPTGNCGVIGFTSRANSLNLNSTVSIERNSVSGSPSGFATNGFSQTKIRENDLFRVSTQGVGMNYAIINIDRTGSGNYPNFCDISLNTLIGTIATHAIFTQQGNGTIQGNKIAMTGLTTDNIAEGSSAARNIITDNNLSQSNIKKITTATSTSIVEDNIVA